MDTALLAVDGRRRRPAISCTLCRRRKIRCDRERPCSNCVRSRSGGRCVYENPPTINKSTTAPQRTRGQASTSQSRRGHTQPADDSSTNEKTLSQSPRSMSGAVMPVNSTSSSTATSATVPSHVSSSLAARSWTVPSTPASRQSAQDAEALRLRLKIKQLESQLSSATSPVAYQSQSHFQSPASAPTSVLALDSDVATMSSHLSGTFHVLSKRDASGNTQPFAHSVSLKTRLFGQSHWGVSGVHLIRDVFNTLGRCEGTCHTWTGIEKCKALARSIKARRAPAWPSSPTSKLPPKEVADTLVDGYLRTTESIYRILHVPTFRRDYEALWVSDAEPDIALLIQLKLVLAIGAITYDDHFSLRTSAIRWVHEAQIWLAEPKFKLRLNIRALQTDILLLFAQERAGVGGDSMWVSSGALLRKAVHMGLHRDPSHLPRRSAYAAEMHRRLWNTILEVNLQSSLTSGGAPFISLDEFDTVPPENLDDDQLEADDPIPKPPGAVTQVSIAIALRKTFSQRLAVVKFLNDLNSPGTYEETLRLDTELRTAYRVLGQDLRACSSSQSRPTLAQSEIQLVDFLMHRYLLSLHAPYLGPTLSAGTAYAYSQKAAVASSLQIWRAVCPHPSPPMRPFDAPGGGPSSSDVNVESDLPRLATCSSGFYPTVAIHAALLIASELRTQLQEEHSLCPAPLRPDLLSVLGDAKAWCLRNIEAGETNVKGYLLMSLVAAQVGGMMRGLGGDEIAGLLVQAVQGVEEKCLPMLEQLAEAVARDPQAQGVSPVDDQSQQQPVPAETMENWAFMMSDALFDPGDTEPMTWMFNDESNSGALVF